MQEDPFSALKIRQELIVTSKKKLGMLHSSSWENVQNMYSQGSKNIMKSRISGHREGKYNTVLLTVLQFFLFMLTFP